MNWLGRLAARSLSSLSRPRTTSRCPAARQAPHRALASAPAVIVTSGGIGGNLDLVRENWPARLGPAPRTDDLRACPRTSTAGRRPSPRTPAPSLVNRDRMWHYVEGIQQQGPDLASPRDPHDPRPRRRCGWTRTVGGCPSPHFPGFDTLGTLRELSCPRL